MYCSHFEGTGNGAAPSYWIPLIVGESSRGKEHLGGETAAVFA